MSDGVRLVTAFALSASVTKEAITGDNEFLKMHCKLGHPSDRIVSQVLSTCNMHYKRTKTICEACQCGKSKFLPFPKSVSHASSPLELIYTDIWGPSPTFSAPLFRANM